MADYVQVDLVTPEKLYASVEATLVEVPGEAGDFGVLPGHAPMISSIRPGVVTLHAKGDTRFLVMGGMAEVTPERCTILAEYVEDVTGVTRDAATSRVAEARNKVSAAVTEEEKAAAAREVSVSEALAHSLASSH